ncbi:MAG: hypothetical protein ACKVS7_15335 [Gemmatimonadaceae bacterium]
MRVPATLLAALLFVACAGTKEAEMPAAAAPTLADFAGEWNVSTMVQGTPDAVASTMSGTADAGSWTMTLPDRPAMAITVSMSGDSLVAQTPEYESVLRKGVMVSVRTASVMKDGALVGSMMATYRSPAGEEKVPGTFTGTKKM